MDRTLLALTAVLFALAGAMAAGVQPGPTPRGTVPQWAALASPPGAGSMAPQLTSHDGRTIMSWIEGAGPSATVRFAERTTTGWSAVRVVASGDRLMANGADVPAVMALDRTSVAAAWLEKNGSDPEAYDIRVSSSKDEGRTWSKPVSPHHDGTRTQHGFVSLFRAAGGGFGLVWLDGRAAAAMALRASTFAPDGTQGAEAVIDTRVCDCCPVSTAATADGVVVAYRDRTADEVRDISVSRLTGGHWTPPARVHQDGWKIAACPVNGPAVAARNRDVAVAWFTVQEGRGRTLLAFSRDGGRRFGPALRVDDEQSVGRPQLALLDDGSAAVSWSSSRTDGRSSS